MLNRSCNKNASKSFIHICHILAVVVLVFGFIASSRCAAQEESSGSRRLVEKVEPQYPTLAKKNNLTGVVRLRVTVAPDGRAKDVAVIGGNPVFIESATESVKKFKWSSAERDSVVTLEVRFNPS